MKRPGLILCFFLIISPLFGQRGGSNILFFDEADALFGASIKDVGWITGDWYGEALGGRVEEHWTPPSAGSMMATFKLIKNNQVQFYELCTISEERGSLILRIKHFNRDLTGWEEKDRSMEFRLVKLTPSRAYFDGFTFERVGRNRLNLYIMLGEEGNEKETTFAYRRR